MTNKKPWEYQEEEIRHETTGAIGAKDPQGNIVYGPLAKQYLTPIESVPKITIPEIEAPATSPGMALIDKTPESWLMQQQQQMQERIEKQQEELTAAKEERKGLVEQVKGFFDTAPKAEEKVRELHQEFGVTKSLELQEKALSDAMNLRNQAILLSEQRDGAIAALGQQGTLTPFITRQQAVIAENYDRRINTLAAQEATQVAMFQAQQGQIQQARGLVSDIVDAMTYDTNLELTKMQTFLDINRDEISMLDTSIQRDLQETTRQLENQLKEEKAERTAVLELMLQYNNAGISQTDTLEDAVVKSQQWLRIQPDAKVEELMAQYPTANIKPSDSFAEAITKIAQLPIPIESKPPTTFGSASGGYYAWTQDAQGNWVPQQIIAGTGGTGGAGTQLTFSDSFLRVSQGLTSREDLTSKQLEELDMDIIRLGLRSAEPQDWFTSFIDAEYGGVAPDDIVRAEWRELQETVLPGKTSTGADEELLELLYGKKSQSLGEKISGVATNIASGIAGILGKYAPAPKSTTIKIGK